MNQQEIFETMFADFQVFCFGRFPYEAGKAQQIKRFAECGVLTYAEAQIELVEVHKSMGIVTGKYAFFGGGE